MIPSYGPLAMTPTGSVPTKAGVRRNPASFGALLARVQKGTEPRLRRLLREKEREAKKLGDDVLPMVSAVRSLAERGGKRLRPALALVGALAVREDADADLVLDAGVALELLQAYFLIHDDWMDQDDQRRGGPTAHVELARVFGSKELGASSAILAGDYSLALATRELSRLALPPARLAPLLACFAEMQVAALYGQQLDIIGKTLDPELTYELKTASYTVRGPLEFGALLVGGKKETLATLTRFAIPAGVAFQLRDDLIGVFGDPALTGKPRGGDLLRGKNTSLVGEARRRASKNELASITRVLGRPSSSSLQIERAMDALEASGARAETERRIGELVHKARVALDGAGLTRLGRKLLEEAVLALSERTA